MRTDRHGRLILVAGLIYAVAVIAVVASAAFVFRGLYADKPYATVMEMNDAYRGFLRISGPGFALYLGTWAAAYGAWRRSTWQGMVVLAAGTISTMLVLSALPWVRFPFDQYAAPAAWIMSNAIPLGIGWAVVTVACLRARRDRD